RCELAARADITPEILYYLAGDPDPSVRRAIALNGQTPFQADLMLATDDDDDVRVDLAGKIGRASGDRTTDDQSSVYRITLQALEVLASDQIVRVRQLLAESLKDLENAPRAVVEKLARDREIVVSGPVLENSPVLDDEFLIDILRSDPVHGALSAISRRVALGEHVADAIVNAGDTGAIADLLGNTSAQIREETLDRIIDDAPDVAAWHKPLVNRPSLRSQAARRIAEIVATPLLADLKKRADLDDETLDAIALVVRRRLDEEEVVDELKSSDEKRRSSGPIDPDWAQGVSTRSDGEVALRARKLHAQGKLNEALVSEALGSSQKGFVVAAVGLLAEVPDSVVKKAVSLQNAKAIVALA
ncbi:MAG: DUF2336 domain-containing protein, partial [Minwuiales bacterium]|nr:DUF2336 domain-containing protein [Minwuiales bacterium]